MWLDRRVRVPSRPHLFLRTAAKKVDFGKLNVLGHQLSFLVQGGQSQGGKPLRLSIARWKRLPGYAAIAVAILGIGLLHKVTPVTSFHWQEIFQHLYYLPVVIAALMYSWRGGVATAVFAGLTNLPYILAVWSDNPAYAMDRIVEIPFYGLAGLLTGIFSGRERKQRQDL